MTFGEGKGPGGKLKEERGKAKGESEHPGGRLAFSLLPLDFYL
jgi:hypothetical protein